MCGIAGMVQIGNGASIEPEPLLRMREALRHRGPDDAGIWIEHDRRVGLAHRRLSILDLSEAGRQPMQDAVDGTWITYNGEIYNFLELRKTLAQRGHDFVSGTDTEVLLVAYREWKTHCLDHLNGMFAFALFDAQAGQAGQLFLARDRAGKKPLYYTLSGGRFLFASELKALLQEPTVSREIDLRALNFFLAYGFVPGELSIFRGIYKLPPAHAMILDLASGKIRRWRYWWLPSPAREYRQEEELLAELELLLEDAVRLRLRSDVPLGVFLSGGVDSSVVVALMNRLSSQPVDTFTIGFEETGQDERGYARIVADYFGTQHHELVIQPDALQVLPQLVQEFDEPFADPSLIPTYYVCRETRKSVTVALSGDGGDELFGGYRRYSSASRDAQIIALLPAPLRRWAATGSRLLPNGSRVRDYIQRLRGDARTTFIAWRQLFDLEARASLFQQDILHELGENLLEPETYLRTWLKEASDQDFINQMTGTDFQVYLPDDILVKVDRASMGVSLEVRSPLLDYRVVEFAFSQVPGALKVNHTGKKVLLRKLAQRLLPPALPLNRKAGFGIPLQTWLGPDVEELREGVRSAYSGLFQRKALDALFRSGGNGDRRVFSLLVFALWRQAYGGGH